MALILQDISKQLAAGFSLSIKELTFEDSRIYAITGPQGSGKTALLRITGLLDSPDSGQVRLLGNLNKKSDQPRGLIAYIAHKPYLFNTTVRENVACGSLRSSGLRINKERLDSILEMTGLVHLAKRPVHYLNPGETRRVALARAVVQGTKVILMDEPTRELDSLSRLQIENALKRINKNLGACIVIATRDVAQARNMSQHVLNMKRGKVEGLLSTGKLDFVLNSCAI